MSTHDEILTGVNQREALAKIIERHMLGVSPDDQDVVLEDHDWRLVLSALRAQQAEAQDEGASGEPFAYAFRYTWGTDQPPTSWAFQKRPKTPREFAEGQHSGVEVQPLYDRPSPSPAADADRVRIAVEALKPFARLELPKKPVGNAGAYSLLHTDIRRAAEAVAFLKSTDDGRAAP